MFAIRYLAAPVSFALGLACLVQSGLRYECEHITMHHDSAVISDFIAGIGDDPKYRRRKIKSGERIRAAGTLSSEQTRE